MPDQAHRIFVVGGAKDFVLNGPAIEHFKRHNIEILDHLSGADGSKQTPPDQLPQGCDGVVIFRDMTGHGAYYAARDLADKAGIPCAAVPRKWCKAEPLLRMQGILPPIKGKTRTPPQSKVIGVAAAYITEERDRGRAPALGEVRAAVKMAFGQRVTLSSMAFNKATAKVVSPPPSDISIEELRSAVYMVMEDDAELHMHPELLREAVGNLINEIPNTLPADQVLQAAKEVLTGWQADRRNPRKQKGRRAASVSWLKKVWRAYIAGGEYPVDSVLAPRFKEVFGWCLNSDWMREARMAVLGGWADQLIGLKAARQRYSAGGGIADFDTIWEAGDIQTVQAGKKKLTGRAAVDTFLVEEKAAAAKQAEVTVSEPVIPEPVIPAPEAANPPIPPVEEETVEVVETVDVNTAMEAALAPPEAPLLVVATVLQRLEALEARLLATPVAMPHFSELLANGGEVTITIKVNPKPSGN